MTLYSDEVRNIVHYTEWPSGLIIEVVEYPDHLGFRLYRDNFERFTGEDKQYIAGLVGQTINKIRKTGIPIYMEVAKGDGRVVNPT